MVRQLSTVAVPTEATEEQRRAYYALTADANRCLDNAWNKLNSARNDLASFLGLGVYTPQERILVQQEIVHLDARLQRLGERKFKAVSIEE